ncbi:MAG: hypothetical protein J5738_08910 [Lachnospiraceae bacterium]|nr:hypothetical protein [Lachnospiraceae bacterium]
MKLTKTARKTIFGMLLVLCLLLPVLMNVSKADNGPKPSITINVKNGPQAYYIAIRGTDMGSNGTESEVSKLKQAHPGEKEHQAIDKIFSLRININRIGTSCYRGGGSGSYRFGYMVPKTFCVVMVTLDGDVIISDDVTKERYNAVFDYDVSTGELRELIKDGRMLYAKGAVICYILTLIFEAILLFPFGLASKKSNWLHFLIANTVTQIILNIYLVNNITETTTKAIVFLKFLFIEIIVLIIEAVYYGITLREKNGDDVEGGKVVGYAFIANLASLVIGSIIFDKVLVEMFNR